MPCVKEAARLGQRGEVRTAVRLSPGHVLINEPFGFHVSGQAGKRDMRDIGGNRLSCDGLKGRVSACSGRSPGLL